MVARDFDEALARTGDRRGRFGEPLHVFDAVGSTNDEAARLAEAGATEGTTVVATTQTAGRGRLGRHWFSPPDAGLYVSVIVRDRRAAPLLTLAAGVAIAAGIRSATALPVEIKWPNDVVIDRGLGRRRKLAGILTEASSAPEGLHYMIVGFGINLLPSAYPPEIGDRATSLAAELDRPIDAGMLLSECLAALAEGVAQLTEGNGQAVLTRWRELSPSSVGARVEFEGAGGALRGITAGIADDGALLVRVGDRIEAVRSGQVSWY